VRRIWWLSTHNRDAIETETLSGAEAVTALTAMSYNSRIAGALLAPDAFLRAAGALARSVPLRRVRRTRGQWRLAELADRIEAAADELPEV
jgi:hypothetical protein